MNHMCNIIADLLPLMAEGVASEDTVAFVRAHLQECPSCRAAYERMSAPAPSVSEPPVTTQATAIRTLRKKLRRRRVLTALLSIALTLSLLTAWLCIKPHDVYYGSSTLYTKQDMREAVRVIEREFRTWEGCRLYTIRYTNDELCLRELDYCNSLADEGQVFTECIVFKSDFRAPLFGAGAWNPGDVYYGWTWYLAREDGGAWVILTSGYA